MGLARIFGICSALLFASSVTAAEIIDLGPSNYRNMGPGGAHTSQGIRSSFGQTTRLPPTLNTLTVTRNPVVPYGAAARGMSTFLRVNPSTAVASGAVTAMFLAMDWYFDQETDSWVKDELVEDPAIGDDTWRPASGFIESCSSNLYPSAPAACSDLVSNCLSGSTQFQFIEVVRLGTSGRDFSCRARRLGGSGDTPLVGTVNSPGPGCPFGWEYSPDMGTCLRIDMTPVNLEDLGELGSRMPSLDADTVATGTGDTQRRLGAPLPGYTDTSITGPSSVSGPETTTTSTDPVSGDTIVTNTTTQTNISYGDTTITTTNTTTTTTYQNGQETSTEVTTETPGELPVAPDGGALGDWPAFCDWATVVCDWISWTQEEPPPEQDLPQVIDEDFFEEKRISFGSKSCPPDHEINLAPFLETTVGVSFQPLCDFASLIYYMVMAASYIIAAYISIGVARNA